MDDIVSNFVSGVRLRRLPVRDDVVANFSAQLSPAERKAAEAAAGPSAKLATFAFDEGKHDRAADGKFAPKGAGGEKAPDEEATETGAPKKEVESLKKAGRKSYPTEGEAKRAVDESKAEVEGLQKRLADLESKEDAGAEDISHQDTPAPDDAMDDGSPMEDHPQWNQSDYEYLKDKGYDDSEIRDIWDRDAGQDKPAQEHTQKAPDVVGELSKGMKEKEDQQKPRPARLNKGAQEASKLLGGLSGGNRNPQNEDEARQLIEEARDKVKRGKVPEVQRDMVEELAETIEGHLNIASKGREKGDSSKDEADSPQPQAEEKDALADFKLPPESRRGTPEDPSNVPDPNEPFDEVDYPTKPLSERADLNDLKSVISRNPGIRAPEEQSVMKSIGFRPHTANIGGKDVKGYIDEEGEFISPKVASRLAQSELEREIARRAKSIQ